MKDRNLVDWDIDEQICNIQSEYKSVLQLCKYFKTRAVCLRNDAARAYKNHHGAQLDDIERTLFVAREMLEQISL